MTQYQVAAVWWPDGWEPAGPLDVPNCLGRAPESGPARPAMELAQAVATVRGLNRQNLDHPGALWYVVAERDEPAAGHAEEKPLEVVRDVEGSGSGDCSHCPANRYPCAAKGP
jgi:hypothetical protein